MQVPGYTGEEKLKIGEGTQRAPAVPDQAKDYPIRGGGRGIVVHVRYWTPTKSSRAISGKLMEAARRDVKVENTPARTRIAVFDKVKEHIRIRCLRCRFARQGVGVRRSFFVEQLTENGGP